jgi:hypothetical protein
VRFWLLLCLPLAVLGCKASLNEGTTFPANYYASGPQPRTLPACAGAITVTTVDGRENPSEAGRRYEEQKPASDYPIKMTGDAKAYVQSALEGILKRAGNPGKGATATTLAVTLDELYLQEKTYVNAEFSAGVALEVVISVGNTPCWKGEITGQGDNYGSVGSTESYQQTLNRAFENAVFNMFRQKKFRDALCGKCASS